ncbi:MAG: type II toxin-antitoxin system VapC family toxin [Alphaproteobacteria bacterium]|nr:type II toxin-antitoxin system VapC family toxin [Alphaproteobacteria bacterium]
MISRRIDLILDTHIWLWLAFDDRRLKAETRRVIDKAAGQGVLHVSAISVWEIALLAARRRIELDLPVRDWVEQSLARSGLGLADLTPDIMIEAYELPAPFHDDPADRMLVATARLRGARLLTHDRLLLAYGGLGHVEVLAG